MANILVSGVAGFIGMAVADRLLARGDTVTGIDNLNSYYNVQLKHDRLAALHGSHGDAFRFHKADFADMPVLNEILDGADFDAVVHLGAQAGVRHSIDNPHAYVQSNLVGHLNMLEIARHRALGHFVYASSSSVYGANKHMPFRVSDRVDHPVSLYAATKRADELMSETYAHLYRLPQTGLRFFTVYGPWGRPDMAMWLFTDRILTGRPIEIFNGGDMGRDFTYIDDIVTGVVACLDNPPPDDGQMKPGGSVNPHRLYNIGNHQPERLMRLVELLEEACGKRAERIMRPMQAGDVQETCADIDVIQQDFGYRPSTSLEAGIPQFVDWFKRYHGIA